MTVKIIKPDVLPEAQTYVYMTDYVEIYDFDEAVGSNTLVNIANVDLITFSVNQPNVSVNVSNNRIWMNGYYTTGTPAAIYYFEPPYGNDLTDSPSIAYNFNDVPPKKYIYRVDQPAPTGITLTHTFRVNYNGGGNGTFTATRSVINNVYAAYNFLTNYQYYNGVE